MNMSYDPIVDALMLRLSAAPVEESDEVAPGVILDYDEDGQVIGIEVLDVSKRAGAKVSIEATLRPRTANSGGEYTSELMTGSMSGDRHKDGVRRYPVPVYASGKVGSAEMSEVSEVKEHGDTAENLQKPVPAGRH